MKNIHVNTIIDAVRQLCIQSNCYLGDDILNALRQCRQTEISDTAKNIFDQLEQNATIARREDIPICQDTGMAVVFVKLGQQVAITGGGLTDAINEGVRRGYTEGYLRKSVVADPLDRINTNDNTPAVIHYDIVEGDCLSITVAPKGFGSENMSAVKMLTPSDGVEGIKDFVISVVKAADSNPCPPIIVGVGIGGTMEKAALMSKQALLLDVGTYHKELYYRNLQDELLFEINALGIGPQGLGGKTTAFWVNVETFATHIAGLPVAVNIGCHVTRHSTWQC